MKQIIIRNLDDSVLLGLKKIAWMDGGTPEDTARRMLIEAVRARSTRQSHPLRVTEPAAALTPSTVSLPYRAESNRGRGH